MARSHMALSNMHAWRRQVWLFAGMASVTTVFSLWIRPDIARPVAAADDSVAPSAIKAKDPQIVPVVCLHPGEKRECILSTDCTVGVTRGGGLSVREMGEPAHDISNKRKTWNKAGLTLTVPDFAEAIKTAESPRFAALKQKGYDAFVVTAEATEDAAAGMYEIHLADDTCSGHCRTTMRVVVHRPE